MKLRLSSSNLLISHSCMSVSLNWLQFDIVVPLFSPHLRLHHVVIYRCYSVLLGDWVSVSGVGNPGPQHSADRCFLLTAVDNIKSSSICSSCAYGNRGGGHHFSITCSSFLPKDSQPHPADICSAIRLPTITTHYHQITVIYSHERTIWTDRARTRSFAPICASPFCHSEDVNGKIPTKASLTLVWPLLHAFDLHLLLFNICSSALHMQHVLVYPSGHECL